VRFVDVLKFYLLDKYGGIFLDCDTFPVKPFDDILLQNEFFACRSLIGKTDFFDDICIFD
jgi:mannosyltransferase OCH1-like enzyme